MIELEQEEWFALWQSAQNGVILDVRTPEEFERIKIPNAINIDIYKGQGFIYQIEQLDKELAYFVYCQAGFRSAKACQIMEELGFTKTYNLIGGIGNWQGPVEE